ncbi:hypothetical protein ACPC27_26735 [Streptomyces cellulosae]
MSAEGAQDVDQERARLQVHHHDGWEAGTHDGWEAGTMIAARRCGAA